MEFHSFFLFLFLICLVEGGNSNASDLSAEVYWKSMLPNTSMPKALQQLLKPHGHDEGMITSTFEYKDNCERIGYNNGYWSSVNKNHTFNSTIIFFLRDDLRPRKRMNLVFIQSTNSSSFLSRKVADSIPFSSSEFSEILNYTSIKSTSKEAQIMKRAIEECEAPNLEGEDKFCATSLESLVDSVVGKFGERVQTLANEVQIENKKQEYIIQNGIKMMGENHIVCHRQAYAYVVYYCHKISDTNVYTVPMVAADGSEAKAVVVCHLDTVAWNPNHFAFQVLNVKPGGPPICHFLNDDSIVWLPN